MKMARLSRATGLSNLARLALERLLEVNGDHVLALRTLKDVLSEIGDAAACREVGVIECSLASSDFFFRSGVKMENIRRASIWYRVSGGEPTGPPSFEMLSWAEGNDNETIFARRMCTRRPHSLMRVR